MEGPKQNENRPPVQSKWMEALDSREHSQIYHAKVYARDHQGAGAPGHGQFILIAKLTKLLDDTENNDPMLKEIPSDVMPE
jgi:hypothetical protein